MIIDSCTFTCSICHSSNIELSVLFSQISKNNMLPSSLINCVHKSSSSLRRNRKSSSEKTFRSNDDYKWDKYVWIWCSHFEIKEKPLPPHSLTQSLTPQGVSAWVVDKNQLTNQSTTTSKAHFFCGFSLGCSAPRMGFIQGCGFSLGFSAPRMGSRGVVLVWDSRPLGWGPGVWF